MRSRTRIKRHPVPRRAGRRRPRRLRLQRQKDLLAQLPALNLEVAAMIERNEPVTATDWRPLTYDFEVKDATGNDVEFVCDFKGTEGEAWFDASSLRVRRFGP